MIKIHMLINGNMADLPQLFSTNWLVYNTKKVISNWSDFLCNQISFKKFNPSVSAKYGLLFKSINASLYLYPFLSVPLCRKRVGEQMYIGIKGHLKIQKQIIEKKMLVNPPEVKCKLWELIYHLQFYQMITRLSHYINRDYPI